MGTGAPSKLVVCAVRRTSRAEMPARQRAASSAQAGATIGTVSTCHGGGGKEEVLCQRRRGGGGSHDRWSAAESSSSQGSYHGVHAEEKEDVVKQDRGEGGERGSGGSEASPSGSGGRGHGCLSLRAERPLLNQSVYGRATRVTSVPRLVPRLWCSLARSAPPRARPV